MRTLKITLLVAVMAVLFTSCKGYMTVDYSIFGKYVFHNDTKEEITLTFDMSLPSYIVSGFEEPSDSVCFNYTQTVTVPGKEEHVFWHPIDPMKEEELVNNTHDLVGFFDHCRQVTFSRPDGTSVTHYNPKFYPEDSDPKSFFLSANYTKEDYFARDGLFIADKSYPIYHFRLTDKLFK